MRNATLLVLAAGLALAAPASAQCTGTVGTDFQRVTIREINAIPQANIDQLNAAGQALTFDQVSELTVSPLDGQRVEVSVVILTNPLLSGLASANDGIPGRIHVFARDTAADTDGVEGMGVQIVDNRGDGSIQQFFVGDEVTVCGRVGFFNTIQLAPESISSNSNPRGATDPILDPVVIATDDIHDAYQVEGVQRSQVDWSVFPDFVNQYVRFESIELVQGIPASANGRPNMLFSTSGDDTTIRSYDTSVCFRNDRATSYFPANQEPTCNLTDFVPPPTGIVNVQGFLTISGAFDAFGSTIPSGGAFAISPFESSDFEVAVAPPIISIQDTGIPSPSGAPIEVVVTPGTQGNTIASVVLNYTTSGNATGQVTLTNSSGDTYTGSIPNLTAGQFVTYTITATDNQNAASQSSQTFLVVDGPVSSIFDVQRTPDGGAGASRLITASPIAFDLDAIVQTVFQTGNRFQATIQDDATLGPFSAVLLDFGSTDPGLSVGDRITISEARVAEFRDVTQLVDVVYTTTGSGERYGPKVVSTALFAGASGAEAAEQHESMLLRFEGGTIISANPDAGQGTGCANDDCGEFTFSTDGTAANQLRVDDASNGVPVTTNDQVTPGDAVVFVQGILSYSFGNTKLIPISVADIQAGRVDVGTGPGERRVEIASAFPNPAGDRATVRFALAEPGEVTLAVYDVMGRQVLTLAQGTFTAASHDVEVDLRGLASGVYVLRLQAGTAVDVARFSIAR